MTWLSAAALVAVVMAGAAFWLAHVEPPVDDHREVWAAFGCMCLGAAVVFAGIAWVI